MALLDISLPSVSKLSAVSNWTATFANLVTALQSLAPAGKHPEDYLAAQARREAARRTVDRLL